MGDCQEQVKEYLKAFKHNNFGALDGCILFLGEVFAEWMSDTVRALGRV